VAAVCPARSAGPGIDAAVGGALFEEVPLRLVHSKVAGWAAQVAASHRAQQPAAACSHQG
jgi:hypothetical protein